MADFSEDIGGVNFTAGPTGGVVDTTIGDTITAVGEFGLDLAKGKAQADLETNIEGVLSDYETKKKETELLERQRKQTLNELDRENFTDDQLNTNNVTVKKYQRQLDKLDKAIKAGKMTAAEAYTRIQSKTKEALSSAPYARKEIEDLLSASSAGVGTGIKALQDQVKADISIETAAKKALEKEYISYGIVRDDPLAQFMLSKYKQEEVLDARTKRLASQNKQAATIYFNKNMSRVYQSFDSNVRGAIKRYGSAENMPKDVKDQLILQQQQLITSAPNLVQDMITNNQLYLVDQAQKDAQIAVLQRKAETNIAILQGKEQQEAATTSLKMMEDQIYLSMMRDNPQLFRTVTILKNLGPAGQGLFQQMSQATLYNELVSFTGLDKLARATHNQDKGAPYNKHPMGVNTYGEDTDLAEAKVRQEKETSQLFANMHKMYSTESDLEPVNRLLYQLAQGMGNDSKEYSKQTYEKMVKFVSSPTFKNNIKKDASARDNGWHLQNALNMYKDEKFIPTIRKELKSTVSVYKENGRQSIQIPLSDLVSISVNDRGLSIEPKNYKFDNLREGSARERAKAKVASAIREFSSKYQNSSNSLIEAYKNTSIAVDDPISSQEAAEMIFGVFMEEGSVDQPKVKITKRYNKETGKLENVD